MIADTVTMFKAINFVRTALKLLWNCSEKIVREKVVSVEAQTRTNEAKITVL